MLLSIFNTISESIFIFAMWFLLTSFFVIFFRIWFRWIIFKILFHSLVIWSIAHLLSITNPLQNHNIVMFVVALFYIFLFFILPKIKKNDIKILSFKSKGIFIIFLFFILILWKWEYLGHANPKIISEKLSLGSNWELTYKSFDDIHSSVWFFNEYWGAAYDTIKYDLDLDGFVDIKTVDSNEDWEIDDIEIYTYNSQKYTLLILLFIFLTSTYLFSGGNKNKKDKWKKKKEDEKSDEVKNKKHLSINHWNQKIIALILLFGLVFSELGYTYAMTEQEATAIAQSQWAQAQKCAADPFDDSLCIWVSKSSRINLQHMQNPKYASEAEAIMKKQKACYTSKCSEQTIINLQNEYKSFVTKWEKITPINFWKDKPDTSWSTEDIDRDSTTNNDNSDSWWWVDTDDWKVPDFDEIIGWIKEAIDDELDWESASKVIWDAIGRAKDKLSDLNLWSDDETGTAEPTPITVEDVSKKLKNVVDVWWEVLDSINWKLINQLEDISSWKTPKSQVIKSLENIIEKNSWKTTWILSDIAGAIGRLKWEEKKLFQEAMEKLWKFKKVANALPFIWAAFEAYNDYADISRTFDWDDNKINIVTTFTTMWKIIISLNPVDWAIDIVSWVIWLMWFTEASDSMQDFSIWNRFKDVVKDAYTDDWAIIMDTLVEAATDTKAVLNDPNAWVFEKWWKTTQFMVTVWYWWVVWWAKWIFNGITWLFG